MGLVNSRSVSPLLQSSRLVSTSVGIIPTPLLSTFGVNEESCEVYYVSHQWNFDILFRKWKKKTDLVANAREWVTGFRHMCY